MNDKYGTVHAADIGGVVKFLPGQQAHVGEHAKGGEERRFDDQAGDGASGGEMNRGRAPKGTSERDNSVPRDMQCARHVFVRRVYVFVERLFGGDALASPVAADSRRRRRRNRPFEARSAWASRRQGLRHCRG